MKEKAKIGIVGLGMIGGSLALALRDKYDVVGYDTDADTCEYVACNSVCALASVKEMRNCLAVFVCVPVSAMQTVLDEVYSAVGNSTIITDVASVKTPFERTRGRYVGGHPMAGTERGGIRAAKPHLFQNAYYVLTGSGADADTVRCIALDIGAIPVSMRAREHDEAVSVFSHVPHAVAYALVTAALKDGTSPIAGSGFLDTTRIAESSEAFWTEVFRLNKPNVLCGIRAVTAELDRIGDMLERDEYDELKNYLGGARKKRAALNRIDLGGETLYVDLVDRVGEFERVTGLIARAGINVTNIALVPGREGASGALRLEFSCAADRDRAREVLEVKKEEN